MGSVNVAALTRTVLKSQQCQVAKWSPKRLPARFSNMITMPIKPSEDFVEFLKSGRFMIQQSRTSGAYVFYPRVAEPRTGSLDLEWVEASGEGTVYATTVQRSKPPAPNQNVVLIDLAEGPRMLSRVEGIPAADVRIGMAVQARIIDEGAGPFVIFRPVDLV